MHGPVKVTQESTADAPDPRHEMANSLGAILKRIDERREELGLSATEVSIAAGLSPHAIRNMRKQWRQGIQHTATPRTIIALAGPLHAYPNWLMSGIPPVENSDGSSATVPATQKGKKTTAPPLPDSPCARFRGEVAPGYWIDDRVQIEADAAEEIPADPRFPAEAQGAYLVRGNAIDRIARDGDYLIVLDTKSRIPQTGDVVVVSRHRNQTREIIARRYMQIGNEVELRVESTDPRLDADSELNAPIRFKAGSRGAVNIEGIVLSVFRPMLKT